MLGMIFGILSAVMVAVHAVLIKSAMKSVEGRMLDLAFWQNGLCGLVLLPIVVLSGELSIVWDMITGQQDGLVPFFSGSLITVSPLKR
jgi:GDP-fucose transporter C1